MFRMIWSLNERLRRIYFCWPGENEDLQRINHQRINNMEKLPENREFLMALILFVLAVFVL